MSNANNSNLNINTILLGLVLGLSGWTLNRVAALSEQMSAVNERDSGRLREILEIRARLAVVEAQIQMNSVALAKLAR